MTTSSRSSRRSVSPRLAKLVPAASETTTCGPRSMEKIRMYRATSTLIIAARMTRADSPIISAVVGWNTEMTYAAAATRASIAPTRDHVRRSLFRSPTMSHSRSLSCATRRTPAGTRPYPRQEAGFRRGLAGLAFPIPVGVPGVFEFFVVTAQLCAQSGKDNAKHVGLHVLQEDLGSPERGPWDPSNPIDDDGGVAFGAQDDRIGNRQDRTAVHDDVLVLLLESRQEFRHPRGVQEFRRVHWRLTAGENIHFVDVRGRCDRLEPELPQHEIGRRPDCFCPGNVFRDHL